MTLRTRLLIVISLLLVTYIATAFVVVTTQRALLIEQVDRRISTLPPNTGAPPFVQTNNQGADVMIQQTNVAPESPFSDLYIGVLNPDGSISNLMIGSLLATTPDIAEAVRETGGRRDIVTVNALDSSNRFRAAVVPQPISGTYIVAAQPLTATDAAITRLKRTLWIAGVVISLVLATAFFWVQRLGLRPIAKVTTAAELIAAGDRGHRVDVRDERTEAGKLGLAFNVMLDEQQATESRLRQFVADASHELRTPLTSVRGYLDLYRQGAFREQSQLDDVVRRLSSEATRMHGLVDDLFSLASLDEGLPRRNEPVDLGQILRDAAQDGEATQRGRRITVVAPVHGPIVYGDSELLIQLTGILVSNALVHTSVDTLVELSASEQSDEALLIVADRGPGLTEAAAAHVFDRFWRGESGRTRTRPTGFGHQSGSGLGLSIAHSITKAHSGAITLTTAPGEGCTFTVNLPIGHAFDF